jgi:hypothetical protein
MSAGVILRLSVGLAVLYGVVLILWYELIRSAVVDGRRRRRRAKRVWAPTAHHRAPVAAVPVATNGRAAPEQADQREPELGASPGEEELDRARRHYLHARQAARSERDEAIEAASGAADEAIKRIERRYSEIEGAFIDEESERISQLFARSPGETARRASANGGGQHQNGDGEGENSGNEHQAGDGEDQAAADGEHQNGPRTSIWG